MRQLMPSQRRRTDGVFGASLLLACCAIVWPSIGTAQPVSVAFEVASIRINKDTVLWPSARVQKLPGGRVVATGVPIRELVRIAYGLGRLQEIPGPPLLDRLVDIEAQAPERYHAVAELETGLPLMLRALLIERLQLRVREETRDAPVYELTLANRDVRLGPNVRREDTPDCNAARTAAVAAFKESGQEAKNTSALMASLAAQREGRSVDMSALGFQAPPLVCAVQLTEGGLLRAHSATVSEIAEHLTPFVDRPFLDRTMLDGRFSLTLTFDPQDPFINPVMRRNAVLLPRPEFSDRLPFIDALSEQLGIRVRGTNGPVTRLVVERMELPSN